MIAVALFELVPEAVCAPAQNHFLPWKEEGSVRSSGKVRGREREGQRDTDREK